MIPVAQIIISEPRNTIGKVRSSEVRGIKGEQIKFWSMVEGGVEVQLEQVLVILLDPLTSIQSTCETSSGLIMEIRWL